MESKSSNTPARGPERRESRAVDHVLVGTNFSTISAQIIPTRKRRASRTVNSFTARFPPSAPPAIFQDHNRVNPTALRKIMQQSSRQR
jgi:hypothetical protein